MKIILSTQDLVELLSLTKRAETIPVIALSLEDGLEGRDFSSQAWNSVRDKWLELGKKYGFEPSQVKGISTETGEVFTQ